MLADPRVREIAEAALALPSTEAQQAYIHQATGEDVALRAAIQAVLAGTRLDPDPARTSAYQGPSLNDHLELPTSIGPYRLIELLGEGGMGCVYAAEQLEPVRRQVALKVIKAGMDSQAIIRRFEAERQALALMDHPNIARVFDAGTTELGRPYFVMELVRGQPITQCCTNQRLPIKERLALFITVCHAIQHAHTKGIIHRDIKASNVLVTPDDHGRPIPKIIDFGIAKSIGPTLTAATLQTEAQSLVGTLQSMSPEQASLNPIDVDTRSDIYSLGVLLYELLTGTTPLFGPENPPPDWLECLRRIREQECVRPSSLVLRHSVSSGAHVRAGQLRGELDWITLKALEKDRERRYQTATGLARDLERYLADEPVEAAPPSTGYRLRKFLRRHRGPVIAAGLVLLALVAGIIGTSLGLIRAWQAELSESQAHELAEQRFEQATRTLQKITFEFADNLAFFESDPALRLRLSELIQDGLSQLLSNTPRQLELELLQLRVTLNLVDALTQLGQIHQARTAWLEMHQRADELVRGHPKLAMLVRERSLCYDRLGNIELAARNFPAARVAYQRLLAEAEQLAIEHPEQIVFQLDRADALRNLSLVALQERDHVAAQNLLEQARTALVPLLPRTRDPSLGDSARAVYQQRLQWLDSQVALIRQVPAVLEDPRCVQNQPRDRQVTFLGFRAHALARRGDHAAAAATAHRIQQLDSPPVQHPWEPLQAYMACLKAAANDSLAAEHYRAAAMECLENMAAEGYFRDPAYRMRLQTATSLIPLHADDAYQQFVQNQASSPMKE